jgi:hypothetical protein
VDLLDEAEPGEHRLHARPRHRVRQAVQPGVKIEVGGHGKLEVERGLLEYDAEARQRRHAVARHVVAHDLDASAVRRKQSAKHLKQRRLAGAGEAQHCNEFAGKRLEAKAIDGADRAEALAHIVQQQSRRSLGWLVHAASVVPRHDSFHENIPGGWLPTLFERA